MEPATSWILVGFVTTEPQQELLFFFFFLIKKFKEKNEVNSRTGDIKIIEVMRKGLRFGQYHS